MSNILTLDERTTTLERMEKDLEKAAVAVQKCRHEHVVLVEAMANLSGDPKHFLGGLSQELWRLEKEWLAVLLALRQAAAMAKDDLPGQMRIAGGS